MENENVEKRNGSLTKISLIFGKIIVAFSMIALCVGLFMGFTNIRFSDIDDFIVSIFEEGFYDADFESVNSSYLKDSVGYSYNLDENIENLKSINITKYMKEDLDWENIYPYMYRYIEKQDENVIFRNQGLYVQIEGEYYLIFYLTPITIYFDINNMKAEKSDDLYNSVSLFINCLCASETFKDIDSDLKFQEDLCKLDSTFSAILLKANMYKPIIYLYPEEEIDIDITIDGVNFTTTYPKYNDGWTVTAYPDGTLIDKNSREYNYLYWEGVSNNFIDISNGFVVSKDNYIEFLEEKLDYIGLSNKESADFISYWLPYMNEFEYCQVSFQMENYEEQVKLDFSIQPDNELRVFVAFKGLSDFVQIEEQDLSYYEDFERIGFTVVEWGGTFIE